MKLIIFFLGLALGLGGGIFWSAKHPSQANAVASKEEKKFIELQLQMSKTIKQKLDQLAHHQQQQSSSNADAAPPATEDINSLRDQQDKQVQRLQQRLNDLK